MDRFLQKIPACTPAQAAVLTDSILNMLVTDMSQLSMVEDGGFKATISTFHPIMNFHQEPSSQNSCTKSMKTSRQDEEGPARD